MCVRVCIYQCMSAWARSMACVCSMGIWVLAHVRKICEHATEHACWRKWQFFKCMRTRTRCRNIWACGARAGVCIREICGIKHAFGSMCQYCHHMECKQENASLHPNREHVRSWECERYNIMHVKHIGSTCGQAKHCLCMWGLGHASASGSNVMQIHASVNCSQSWWVNTRTQLGPKAPETYMAGICMWGHV